jgi:glycosyltransferase involved in cell wall biosynthesis
MKPLRILQIVPSLGIGGAETMAAHLAGGLAKRGHTVGVASMYGPEQSQLQQLLARDGVQVYYLGKRPGCDLRIWPRLARALADFQPDVSHSHLGILHYVLPPLLRHKPPLMIHTVHSLAEKETLCWSRWSYRPAFRAGVIPVAVSAAVAASLDTAYGVGECREIANGIQVTRYRRADAARNRWRARHGFSAADVLFVCVARLKPVKNHRLLLEAFAAGPVRHVRAARLVLLGEGPLQPALESYARELGIDGRTHFLGLRMDVPDALAAADIFVLASECEGNPLSVMEAMAAGLPVVSTAVGGVPELVASGQHGILVAPGDRPAFTNAMRTLLDDPAQRAFMAEAAREHAAAAFDVERMAQGYASIYKTALACAGRPGMLRRGLNRITQAMG